MFLSTPYKLIFFLIFLLFSGCTRKAEPSGSIVARVNDSYLTLEEANKRLLAFSGKSWSLNDVISGWIHQELLFQAAIKNGLQKDKQLNSVIDEFRKNLIGNAYLELFFQKEVVISNEEIKNYYEVNREYFVRLTNSAKIYHFVLKNEEEAQSVKHILEKKKAGNERKKLFSSYLVDTPVVKEGFLVDILNEALFGKQYEKIIGPVKTGKRYHVIEVLERYQKGSSISLDEAYDEIYQRLLNKKYALRSLEILDSLQAGADIEINLENVK